MLRRNFIAAVTALFPSLALPKLSAAEPKIEPTPNYPTDDMLTVYDFMVPNSNRRVLTVEEVYSSYLVQKEIKGERSVAYSTWGQWINYKPLDYEVMGRSLMGRVFCDNKESYRFSIDQNSDFLQFTDAGGDHPKLRESSCRFTNGILSLCWHTHPGKTYIECDYETPRNSVGFDHTEEKPVDMGYQVLKKEWFKIRGRYQVLEIPKDELDKIFAGIEFKHVNSDVQTKFSVRYANVYLPEELAISTLGLSWEQYHDLKWGVMQLAQTINFNNDLYTRLTATPETQRKRIPHFSYWS